MDQTRNYNLVVVLGPTATGKTSLAVNIAKEFNGEIISADSRQVYKEMNLGTGKDYDDYIVDGENINYHLVDIKEPGYQYNVFEYQKDFLDAFYQISDREKIPVLCGGTGMYIEAAVKGYHLINVPVNEKLRILLQDKSLEELEKILATYKKLHNKTDTDTRKRAIRAIEIAEYYKHHVIEEKDYPGLEPVYFGIAFDVETRRERIKTRLLQRVEAGMIEEVEGLLQKGLNPEQLIYYGLEYKYITLHITGQLGREEMIDKLYIAIRQFAKRQMTWFRKMEREGTRIHWIDGQMPMQEKMEKVKKIWFNKA